MSDSSKAAVRRQFGPNAGSYTTSPVHTTGSDLVLLPQIARLTGTERVLDVATATGNTAFSLAPFAAQVIGIDLTPEMLAEASRQAAERGMTNVAFQEGDAEQLPFDPESFAVVTCRIAAHHFPDVPRFCAEAYRVLRPGGRLVIVDNVAPEDDALDAFINDLDRLRDPSHVRAYRLSEWLRFLVQAGFEAEVAHRFGLPNNRENWLARMSVEPAVAAEVRRRFDAAPAAARVAFSITAEAFTHPKVILLGRK